MTNTSLASSLLTHAENMQEWAYKPGFHAEAAAIADDIATICMQQWAALVFAPFYEAKGF